MQALTIVTPTPHTSSQKDLIHVPKMRRQTHMYCTICFDVAESYSPKECHGCGSALKWSIPWKNHNHPLHRETIDHE
jgi:hypothetical protein